MSITNFTSKFNFSGKGYLDAKLGPYANLEELIASIDKFELAEGLSATVLDDGNGKPCDFWYIGKKWVRKEDSQMRADIDSNTLWNEEQDKQVTTLQQRIEAIAQQSTGNQKEIGTLSDRINAIAGIDKLKAGTNIEIVDNGDGTKTINASGSGEPVDLEPIKKDIQALQASDTAQNSRMDTMQAQIDSIEAGTGDVKVDGTSITNEGGVLSVKVSANEGNFLKKENNGMYAGIPVEGDDCGYEIQ